MVGGVDAPQVPETAHRRHPDHHRCLKLLPAELCDECGEWAGEFTGNSVRTKDAAPLLGSVASLCCTRRCGFNSAAAGLFEFKLQLLHVL